MTTTDPAPGASTPSADVQATAPGPRAISLSDRVRTFLAAPNYATLATIGEDGTPHQAVIWYRLDPDDRILVNSRSPRRWQAIWDSGSEIKGSRSHHCKSRMN